MSQLPHLGFIPTWKPYFVFRLDLPGFGNKSRGIGQQFSRVFVILNFLRACNEDIDRRTLKRSCWLLPTKCLLAYSVAVYGAEQGRLLVAANDGTVLSYGALC